ncbi:MAG TPA: hypothetical protein DCO82_09290, partial [Alphaproteobacteria bacterium]|nr:hypothetical protein [Alphaproteobacteria bacterium]
MTPCILALDLGTQTGWALAGSDGLVDSGTVSFAPRPGERKGARFVRFRTWLNDLKAAHEDISEVFYERVNRHTGVQAAHVYGGLLATLMTWAEHHNIDYDGVGVQAIKKFATGKGNAKKEQII